MNIGEKVFYKGNKAQIIKIKWGLYCIRFDDSPRQIWVAGESLSR